MNFDLNPIGIKTESHKRFYWKSFQRRRDSHLVWARKTILKALSVQFKGWAKHFSEVSTPQEMLNYEINPEPMEKAYTELYRRVGGDFALSTFRGLKSSGHYRIKTITESDYRDYIENWLRTVAADRVVGVNDVTVGKIRSVLDKAISQDMGIAETSRIMSREISGISRIRSERIARTEIVAASNKGALVSAQATGLTLKKSWLSTRDDRTRESHVDADGQTKALAEPFLVDGEQMEAPGDPSASPGLVINCRCTVIFEQAEAPMFDTEIPIEPQSQLDEFGVPLTRDLGELDTMIKGINENIITSIPKNANPEIVALHYKAIKWGNDKMGGFKTRFKYEYTIKAKSTYSGTFGYWDPNRTNELGKGAINGKYAPERIRMINFADTSEYNSMLQKTSNANHFANGTTIDSILAHEIAHLADNLAYFKNSGMITAARQGGRALFVGNEATYSKAIRNFTSSKEILDQVYIANGINIQNLNDRLLAGQTYSKMARLRNSNAAEFGRYASTNDAEFIAMAVQYEYLYPGKNAVAKLITELVFKRYKGAFQ
jgi:hypothetical protein